MVSLLHRAWKSFEAYQQKRADYILLQTLSDRELRDIGIGRSQIKEVTYGEYEGR